MRIIGYKDIDRNEWRALVVASETGTWFQGPEAYDFFAQQPSLFKPFIVAIEDCRLKNEDCKLRGVCVGYVTVEKNAVKQFLTRRAIIIGGPCLADDCTEDEAYALMQAVRQQLEIGNWKLENGAPIYIETRNFNDYSRWKGAFEKAGFEYKKHLNFHVDSEAENLSENRCRQLRKVQSRESRVESREAANETEIREWYEVLEELYRTKVKTPLWPVEFFLEAYRQGVGRFLLVKYEGKVIGGSMVVTDGKSVYEWFECGRNSAYKEQYPSVMATYAGIQLARELECKRYDMMGAGEPGVPYGVRDFKSEFGGTLVEHGRFLCVQKPLLYKIGVLGVKLLKRKQYEDEDNIDCGCEAEFYEGGTDY